MDESYPIMTPSEYFKAILHFWERETFMTVCELCGSSRIRVLKSARREPLLLVHFCLDCRLLQNGSPLGPTRLEGNQFQDYLNAQDEIFELTRRQGVLQELVQQLGSTSLPLAVYDVGAGSGAFLALAKERGFSVSGNELSSSSINLIDETFGFKIEKGNFEEKNYVSELEAVTLFCVLAHSVSPSNLLESIHKSLRPGGVCYLHTPRLCLIDLVGIFGFIISKGKLDQLLFRRVGGDHRRIYSRKAMKMILQQAGFQNFKINALIGYGLKKEKYFESLGLSLGVSKILGNTVQVLSIINLLPRNVFEIYAYKPKWVVRDSNPRPRH